VRLRELTVRSFRNLANLDVNLPEPGVVIIGENGHGKTNLLEAIYYLVLFRSLRGAKDRELVRFGEAGFFVGGQAEGRTDGQDTPTGRPADRPSACRVTAGYDAATRRKKVTVDGLETHKLSEAVGHMLAVPFSPADVAVVAAGPGARRRYLDVVLSVSAPSYLSRLTDLKAALRQRNAALKRGRADEARAFDAPFAAAAAQVIAARRQWVERRHERFAELCQALGEGRAAELRYHGTAAVADEPEAWCAELGRTLERDMRHGATTAGPHRDDLRLSLGGRELRAYGSAGQQRTAAVALRLLEAETLAEARGAAPVALYDDVFAELDEGRQARLLELIRAVLPGQAIVTAPRDAEVPAALFDRPRWQMVGGRLVS
jgi:DNA replication and repair protein RecF